MAAAHSAICPRLIGRVAYLESVSLLLGQMRQGHGHTLLLASEAGIGKSRLIAEIKTGIRRDTALTLQGNCFEPDRSLPYGPLTELAAYLPLGATAPLISIALAASLMLTAREREVAALVAQGKSNRAIADELVISERTTESHVANILGKLGVSSRAKIAAWAVDIGLTQPDASPTQTSPSAPPHRARRPATRRSR